jgi:hypothetical protein
VRVLLRPRRETEDKHNPNLADQDLPETEEEFDEIVFCVLADTAKRVLGKQARGTEKWVLGNTTWSDDVTVTHSVSGVSDIGERMIATERSVAVGRMDGTKMTKMTKITKWTKWTKRAKSLTSTRTSTISKSGTPSSLTRSKQSVSSGRGTRRRGFKRARRSSSREWMVWDVTPTATC